MSTLLIATKADETAWNPSRNARLNGWALMKKLHPNAHVFERVVAIKDRSDDLIWWLRGRREGMAGINRFEEEGYILAFDAKLKSQGKPAMSARQHAAFRRAGPRYDECLGLDLKTEFFEVWERCVAKWHAKEARAIPPAVKLLLHGARNLQAIEEEAGILLEDPVLRRLTPAQSESSAFIAGVIRQWVDASGGVNLHQEVVNRMLGQDKDHRLLQLAEAGGYAKLAPEMIDVALHITDGDTRLAFFVFRCMQRVAACQVAGEVMWFAEWLRGANANHRAIPGTTGKPKLVDIMQNNILGEVTKRHSGAAAIPTTYRVNLLIQLGTCGPAEAAQRLGIVLNAKELPRR